MSEFNNADFVARTSTPHNGFKRDTFYKVSAALAENDVILLLGPRKCGKTICLMQLNQYLDGSIFFDFKTVSDEDSVSEVNTIINDILTGNERIYLLDEITNMYHPEEEIARIAQAYTKATALNVNVKTKVVLTGSQSVALQSWGRRAFCNKAVYIKADFLNYVEWSRYKDISSASEDSFKRFIADTKEFYRFHSLRAYLEGCLEETVTSNIKSKNLIIGNECTLLDVDSLLTVLYATLFSLHDRSSATTFFKDNSVEDRLKYLISSNQIITDIDRDEVKTRVGRSFIGKYNKLKAMDIDTLKQALIFLYQCDLITLTPVLSDFETSIDIYKALVNDDTRLSTKDKLFKLVNICIKYPMFYVEILKDVLGNDFSGNLSNSILGAIVECYVRGLLPSKECCEYHSLDDCEIDYVNLEYMCAIEITISNKKDSELWFRELPVGFKKILLTRDVNDSGDIIKIPYYEFVFGILKDGLQGIIEA